MPATATTKFFPYQKESPWPKPDLKDCLFYHALDLADGTSIDGAWDIRGNFENYIGNYDIKNKSMLDIGTASGYLAFEAEKAGALVTAHDAHASPELERLPFKDSLHHRDRTSWSEHTEQWFRNLKNGFWYAWHANQSKIDVMYAPLDRLPYWNRRFDVVLAGAIFEHLANPIVAIGNLAGLANEAVIIAFTPVGDTDAQIMETANDWSSPEDSHSFTWWTISRGLYKRVFDNLGFDVEFVTSTAKFHGAEATRPTIIARRRLTASAL